MLFSIENPPSDPSCPPEISQLKSSSSTDDVDLFKSGLDDDENNHHPLPKFSIRDYVFSARNKDIETNWPFSQKNLQLCLKHGVKELLPPFQPIDCVRNRSIKRCTAETSLIDKENISNSDVETSETSLIDKENISNSDGETSGPCDDFVSVSLDCAGGSEGDKQHSLTTNNQSQFEINSVPADRTPCAAIETNTSLEDSGAESTGPPASQNSENTNQPPVKKCRLIVKVGTGADPSSNEDTTTTNCATFPEPMASKVCPVCKTFSSSSNTKLNAHIDQCLSVESTIMWTANSRAIKHRIKPKKTRLMVDIYSTALHCTLEDLDRRNGTNWAMNSSLRTQQTAECAEEEKQRAAPVNFKDNGDEGAVYIDAKGKKLRILSKFNDTYSSVPGDLGTQKPFRGRGSNLLSKKSKKLAPNAQKHHKYLKLAAQSKKFCSSKLRRTCEVRRDVVTNFALEESCKKVESLSIQPFKAQEKIKRNDSGTITKWACSKRTALLKRWNRKEGLRHLRCHFRQELPVESDQSSLGDSYKKTRNSSESSLSTSESSKRMENSSFQAPINECYEQPPVRKRVGFCSLGSQASGKMERFLESPKHNGKQLREESTSMDGSFKDFDNCRENYIPSPSKKQVVINVGVVKNSSQGVCSNLSRSPHAFSSKGTKLSSLRKRTLSVNQSSKLESKYKLNQKHLARKRSEVRCVAEFDKETVALPSEVFENHDSREKNAENQSRIEESTDKVSRARCNVLKVRKKRRAFSISREEPSTGLKSALECRIHDVGNNIDSFARVGGDLAETFDGIKSGRKRIETHCEDIMSLKRSLDPEFQKLASPSNTLAGSLQSVVFKRSLCGSATLSHPTDPSLGDEQEMFYVDEIGNCMIAQNTCMGTEMDYKDGQGNYFTEVDPILIPGPPGSFLPSPRAGDMGSEDLQGNSSLTTSRVQSSEDHHDLVDRDSSDSPISAISTISNSPIARSDCKSSEELYVGPHVAQDEIRSGFAGGSHDAIAESTAPVPQAAAIRADTINLDEFKVNMIIVPEKGPSSFSNDQPCCCSRKGGASPDISLNYQESQLLRRRNTASAPLPAMGKQLNCDPNRRSNSLNSMQEVISLGDFPSSGSGKVVLPTTKSAGGTVSADCALTSPVPGDFDSPSPSTSNSILRLMGKNLMVVNKDENSQQFSTLSGVYPRNFQNEDFNSFHHMVHQHSLNSGQSQCNTGFEVKLSNSFGSHVTSKTPQTPSHTPAGMFSSKNVGGGFTVPFEQPEYKVRFNLPNDQGRSRNADSNSNPMKEYIVIDDTPEGEAVSAADAPYYEGLRESRVSSAGISLPIAANYNSRHVNPFYSHRPQDSSPYSGSPLLQSGANASPIKWIVTPEGSAVLPPSSLMASSLTGHLRSSLYYSPSFS